MYKRLGPILATADKWLGATDNGSLTRRDFNNRYTP